MIIQYKNKQIFKMIKVKNLILASIFIYDIIILI